MHLDLKFENLIFVLKEVYEEFHTTGEYLTGIELKF